MDNLTARTLLNSEEEKLPPQNISGLSNITRLRAESHYRQFCRKLFTPGTKICQRISFRMRTHICDFSKIPKSGKNIKDTGVLGWGWPIFPNLEKLKEPAAKAVNSRKEWLNIDGKVTNVGKSAKFIIHTDVFIACSSKLHHGLARFSLSLQRPFNAERWAYSFLQDPGKTPPIWPAVGVEQRKP